MLIYAIVFFVTISLFMLAIPLLTEQYTSQPPWIYPRSYESLVDALASPTPDIAYIFGVIDYVLPIMIVCSWILTASLLRGSAKKIGKVKFWVIISIPLVYQFITYIVKNTNLITDPNLVQFVYSSQFQISLQISLSNFWNIFCHCVLSNCEKNTKKGYEKLLNNMCNRHCILIWFNAARYAVLYSISSIWSCYAIFLRNILVYVAGWNARKRCIYFD